MKNFLNKQHRVSPSRSHESNQNEDLVASALEKLYPPFALNDPWYAPHVKADQLLDALLNFFVLNVAMYSKNEGSAFDMD